jgi:hypothetical protein
VVPLQKKVLCSSSHVPLIVYLLSFESTSFWSIAFTLVGHAQRPFVRKRLVTTSLSPFDPPSPEEFQERI